MGARHYPRSRVRCFVRQRILKGAAAQIHVALLVLELPAWAGDAGRATHRHLLHLKCRRILRARPLRAGARERKDRDCRRNERNQTVPHRHVSSSRSRLASADLQYQIIRPPAPPRRPARMASNRRFSQGLNPPASTAPAPVRLHSLRTPCPPDSYVNTGLAEIGD